MPRISSSILTLLLLAIASASPASALENCDGDDTPGVIACLRRNQSDLQTQIEGLRQAKPTAVSHGARTQPAWAYDEHGCKIWNLSPVADERLIWTGPCHAGVADGHGALLWFVKDELRASFVGTLRQGHFHQGTQIWRAGSLYEGGYRNDRAEGQGTYRSTSNEIFSGLWHDGCFRKGANRAAIGVPIDNCM